MIDSPDWIKALPQAQDENVVQLFVVAGMGMDKTTATISMHERDENGAWKHLGNANIRYEGCEMMIEIDRGYVYDESAGGLWNLRFKDADNYIDGDAMSFYTSGDSAPYGRYSFVFSEKK